MPIADNPILIEDQKNFLAYFRASPLCEIFYLTGGTALSAFYLRHRLSEDLDFFSEEGVSIEQVLSFVKSVPLVSEVQYERKYDRKIFLLQLCI
jgi:predicted nucleotidyltransferase component of viral defense system